MASQGDALLDLRPPLLVESDGLLEPRILSRILSCYQVVLCPLHGELGGRIGKAPSTPKPVFHLFNTFDHAVYRDNVMAACAPRLCESKSSSADYWGGLVLGSMVSYSTASSARYDGYVLGFCDLPVTPKVWVTRPDDFVLHPVPIASVRQLPLSTTPSRASRIWPRDEHLTIRLNLEPLQPGEMENALR